MNQIPNIGHEPGIKNAINSIKKSSTAKPNNITPALPCKDSADISTDWQNQVDWQAEIQDLLDNLHKSFPRVEILLSGNMSKDELRRFAAVLGKGNHLILSEDFLAKMGSSKENFEAGKAALIDAFQSLSGQTADIAGKGVYLHADKKMSWTLTFPSDKPEPPPTEWQKEAEQMKNMLKRMQELQEQQKERREKSKDFRNKTTAADYKTAGSYAKLASAGSPAQVQWVMGEARRKISKLQIAAASSDSEESMRARAAIKSYQKLLMRGGRKIRRLNDEELTRLREKQAERKEKEAEAFRLKQEQEKQKTKRKTADHMLVEEGRLNDLNQWVYSPRRHKYHVRSSDVHTFTPVDPVPSAPAEPIAPPEGAGGGEVVFTPADVTITSE